MRADRFVTVLTIGMALFADGLVSGTKAASYPTKPIRLVVAQAPGGAADIQMRLFAQKASEGLGQQIIVDNRVGGGVAGITTLTLVAKANPDGYTLMHVGNNFTYTPALLKDFPIDPIRDFAPVSLLARAPLLLVVNPTLPAKSVSELIALAKAQPGKLNFGAGSIGTGTHLITMRFVTAAGIKATYIPYKSTGPALLDVVAGRTEAAMTSVISSGPYVKAGKLRALGISTAERSKVLPDIPTIAEQGVPGFDASAFVGWVAPANTPAVILKILSVEAARAARSPTVADRLKDDGGEPVGSTPEQFRQFIAEEVPRWRKLIQDLGIVATPE